MPIDPSDHTVRTLAEILREHGLETDAGTRPGRRRRWDDSDDTGVERRREPAPPSGPRPDARGDGDGALPVYGRRATDAPLPKGPDDGAGPTTSSISGLRTSRKPGVPGAASPAAAPTGSAAAPAGTRAAGSAAEPAARPGAQPAPEPLGKPSAGSSAGSTGRAAAPARAPEPAQGPSTAERRAARHRTGETGRTRKVVDRPETSTPRTGPGTPRPYDDPPTGKVPKITDPIPEFDETPQGPLAWARFVGELVVAVAVGVGVYFAFTALWELQPYVAVVAAPLVVTALVGGVQWWRDRHRRGALGLRMTAVLLFAGTLLTIAPAGALLSG